MDWIRVALWALVFMQGALAIRHDGRGDDMKCIKHYLFAFGLMWAISEGMQ